jgi:sulfonate transport system substrate-binding protein
LRAKMIGKQLISVIMTSLLFLPLAACGQSSSPAAGSAPNAAPAGAAASGSSAAKPKVESIKLDYAYYNPVSIVLKEKKFLEDEFSKDGIKIEWVLSAGSNKSLELLNSKSIDFGSTAGAAALLGKANGNPIKAIYVYSKPEWTALVARADSKISKVEDLKGKKIAVTRGTDPHIFLLRALDRAGLGEKDVEIVQLQHPDGKNALEKGDVDAWAGLDPYMAQTEVEKGSKLFFRDASLNTYGVLNVREAFAKENPELTQRVLQAYEKARKWSIDNPAEFKKIVGTVSNQTDPVIAKVLERTDITNPVIGDTQKQVLKESGDVLLKSGIIPKETNVDQVIGDLIDPQYITKIFVK